MVSFRCSAEARLGVVLCIVLGLAIFPAAHAGTTPPIDVAQLFDQGVVHYKQNQYGEALRLFNRAYAGGDRSPALFFNRGMCHYRLGQWYAARQDLGRILYDAQLGSLATYNLALVMEQLDEPGRARSYLVRVTRTQTAPEQLKSLAQQRLDTEYSEAPIEATTSVWLAAGYEEDLFDPDLPTLPLKGSRYRELLLDDLRNLSHTDQWDLLLESGFMWVDYLDHQSFDSQAATLGLRGIGPANVWRQEPYLGLEYDRLGDESALAVLHAGLDLRQLNQAGEVVVGYRYSRFEDLVDLYEPLSGGRHQLTLSKEWGEMSLHELGLLLESNHRDDGEAGRSFSPTRYGISYRLDHPLGGRWSAAMGAAWRFSDYGVELSGGGGSGSPNATSFRIREDQEWLVDLELVSMLGSRVAISINYSYTDNDSTAAEFDYSFARYGVGVIASF